MDFNQLKDLKSTWGENRTIVPEWVEGQSFYVVSDELLKQLINEINESRLLREQIAGEILAKCKNEKETNTSEFGSYEVVGCLEFIQLEDTAYYEVTCTHAEDAAIARGNG